MYVSSYYCMCPHTTLCPHITICILILLYMRPHTTIYVLILLCVLVLPYRCPQTRPVISPTKTLLVRVCTAIYVSWNYYIRLHILLYVSAYLPQIPHSLVDFFFLRPHTTMCVCAHTSIYIYASAYLPQIPHSLVEVFVEHVRGSAYAQGLCARTALVRCRDRGLVRGMSWFRWGGSEVEVRFRVSDS